MMAACGLVHCRRVPALLHHVFDRAVGRWPDAVAIDVPPGGGRPARQQVTYRQLDAAASELAGRLAGHVHGETMVAIVALRESAAVVAAQLGVLRAGAAFTCLDPTFPDGQVRELLDDAAPAAIVADPASAARLARLRVTSPVVELDAGWPAAIADSSRDPIAIAPPSWLTPASLAYAIYTSGTSGQPKGVLIEHRSIANLVTADLEEFGLGPGDRVVQGSSAAYDSSIEETWLALAAGATLVIADDATVRLGPDLVAWLADERITVFCPPPTLLRSTGCADPARALPHLRLLYVGGEPLPPDVAERWAPGRQLINGYGPTETTVTVVRERVTSGADIAIGRPIAGVTACVLADDGRDAPPDAPGELCIGGAAVARGYRGLPELTASRFVDHPVHGRIYRTGDLAAQSADGRLFYRGRLDAQVKLRGYRIELEAIEARLAACDGVAAAAAAVQGEGAAQRLVAFVVPRDLGARLEIAPLLDHLRRHLPGYMVPASLGVVDALPTTVGSKLDRAALPRLDETAPARAAAVAPRTAVEATIASAMQAVLMRPHTVSIDDDFFVDLGGDSLAAGLLVSRLRETAATARLATRDVYEARTAAGLAARVSAEPASMLPTVRPALASTARVAAATAVQTAWILGELAVVATLAWLVVARIVPWIDARAGLTGIVIAVPILLGAVSMVWAPVAVLLTAAASRVLLGRCQAGRVPAWGSLHVRWWIVQRLAAGIPWDAMVGTHALTVTLRMLGARVGHHVHVHHGVDLSRGGWHLLTLGDRVSLARDVSLRTIEFDDGHLVIGPIAVDDGATLDVHAGVGPGAHVGREASLAAWASLGAGGRVPDGERWEGVPAKPAGRTAPVPVPDRPGALSAWTHTAAMSGAHAVVATVFWMPALAAALTLLAGLDLRDLAGLRAALWSPALWLGAGAACVAALAIALTLAAALCRAIGPERAGIAHARSWISVRVELKTSLVDAANTWLSGALFWPWWLRAAGMRLGRQAEVSTIVDTVPDLVTIGDESFFADGIYLAGPRVDRGTLTLAPVTVGDRVVRRQSCRARPWDTTGRRDAARRVHRGDAGDGRRAWSGVAGASADAAAPAAGGGRSAHHASAVVAAARQSRQLGSGPPASATRLVPGRGMVGRSPAGRGRIGPAPGARRLGSDRRGRRGAGGGVRGPEMAAARPCAPGDASALVVLVQPLGLPLRAVGPLRPVVRRAARGHALAVLVSPRDGDVDRPAGAARARVRADRRPRHDRHRRRRHGARDVPGPHVRGPGVEDRPRAHRPQRDRGPRRRAPLRHVGRRGRGRRRSQRGDEGRIAGPVHRVRGCARRRGRGPLSRAPLHAPTVWEPSPASARL